MAIKDGESSLMDNAGDITGVSDSGFAVAFQPGFMGVAVKDKIRRGLGQFKNFFYLFRLMAETDF